MSSVIRGFNNIEVAHTAKGVIVIRQAGEKEGEQTIEFPAEMADFVAFAIHREGRERE